MCKFVKLIIDRKNSRYENTRYLSNVMFLYSRYAKFLNDDYAPEANYMNLLDLIEKCGELFYVVLNREDEDFAGFIYLDNPIGNSERLHSCEITACIEKKYWGNFNKKLSVEFFGYCFNTLGLRKIKAQIYPFNNRVRSILKYSGFQKDGILRGETLKCGKLQDVEVYSLLKSDYEQCLLTKHKINVK